MEKPDYSTFTMQELLEVSENIDRDAWPERYQEIQTCIAKLRETDTQSSKTYNQATFTDFCFELQGELQSSVEDELLSIWSMFSKKIIVPNELVDIHCPLCSGKLAVKKKSFYRWKIICQQCQISAVISGDNPRGSNF